MDDTTTLLEQLRDVRQPLPPEGVSLWLIMANVGVAIFIIALLGYRRYQRRNAWRIQLLKDLRRARQQPPQKAFSIAATLLRQLVLFRGQSVQTLSGKPWLQILDKQFQTQWFTQEQGRLFGDALYQPDVADKHNVSSVLDELETLIRKLPAGKRDRADVS